MESSSSSPTPAAAPPRAFRLLPAALALGFAAALLCAPASAAERRQCQGDLFCVTGIEQGRSVEIWVESLTQIKLTVAFQVEARNLDGDARPKRLVLAAAKRERVYRFQKRRLGDWDLDWRYSYHFGVVGAQHDDSVVYLLPYRPGASYKVLQGYDGNFTHKGHLRYSVDWAMPEGSDVLAARGGVVVRLRESSDRGGTDPGDRGRENYIWIRHDDGTLAQYQHLQKDGVLVERGDRVEAGQLIARSGNTGYSTEPHLHFHVATPSRGRYAFVTIPVRFKVGGGVAESLRVGWRYTAP